MYEKLFDLEGKVVIVTGGAGLLGRQFCHGLAAHGANVACVDLNPEAVADLAAELSSQYGRKSIGLTCDVSNPESVGQMVDQVVADMGGVHVLLNNAASKSSDLRAFFAPFEDYSLSQWREVMSVNLDGVMLMAQRVGKEMIRQGTGGSIVQTASIYGVVGPNESIYEGSHYLGGPINTPAVYAASKAGVIGLTRWIATTWAKHGIRCNTLTPGGNESGQNETFIQNYSQRVPMARMGQPREMVGAVVYLASDASSYVTGQNIIVDGGWTAW